MFICNNLINFICCYDRKINFLLFLFRNDTSLSSLSLLMYPLVGYTYWMIFIDIVSIPNNRCLNNFCHYVCKFCSSRIDMQMKEYAIVSSFVILSQPKLHFFLYVIFVFLCCTLTAQAHKIKLMKFKKFEPSRLHHLWKRNQRIEKDSF